MGTRALLAGAVAVAALAAAPAGTFAKDPGRWRLAKVSQIPIAYNQGVAANPARQLFFTSNTGVFRTTSTLRETLYTANVFPGEVQSGEGYDHIGDLAFDRKEGGRLLLPLECYRVGEGNHCGTGSIGVADPASLQWRYYVKLDPRDIKKAMWVESDGTSFWTQDGDDLLRYDLKGVSRANAAPTGKLLRPAKRFRKALPTGMTGAAFSGGRLYVATGDEKSMRVFSIDPKSGKRRLEIDRKIAGESEGLAFAKTLGGTLQWSVLPFDPAGRPATYGNGKGALLTFSATR